VPAAEEVTVGGDEGEGGVRLADWGAFHAGGRIVEIAGRPGRQVRFTSGVAVDWDPNGRYRFGQAYVQYMIPAGATRPPVLIQHGGGLSGAMWETTPDGRPGWARLFLAAGHPVYVLDGTGRGRAGWCPFPELNDGDPVMRSAEEAWTLFRLGAAEGFAARRPFAGQRFPVGALDALLAQFCPRWSGGGDEAVAALLAAMERIGPCVLVAHSQGGEFALRAAFARPGLALAVACIEASGFPPPPSGALAGRPFLHVLGDFLDASALWTTLAARTEAHVAALRAAGARAERWRLPALGLPGHSHMPMHDLGSETLAARLLSWIAASAPPSGLPHALRA
jgi:pimeloyl-ACP methyl ester carboxylesterase